MTVIDAPVEEVLSITPEEYAARIIGRLCECATQAIDDNGMLVNYSQLPEIVWTDIAPHFNLELNQHDLSRMQQTTLRDARRPNASFRNTPRDVPADVRAAAVQWIQPHRFARYARFCQYPVDDRRSDAPAAQCLQHHDFHQKHFVASAVTTTQPALPPSTSIIFPNPDRR